MVPLWNRPPNNLLLLTGIAGETFVGGTGLFQNNTFTIHPSWCTGWEMNAMMNLNMYRLQAMMSTYTYSLRLGGKLFLRACPLAVIEWHVHYILDEVVNYWST